MPLIERANAPGRAIDARFAPHVRLTLHDEGWKHSGVATSPGPCQSDHDRAIRAPCPGTSERSGEAQPLERVDT